MKGKFCTEDKGSYQLWKTVYRSRIVYYVFTPLTCNFSLEYPYLIQQTVSENKQTYQVEVLILIKYQILKSNL